MSADAVEREALAVQVEAARGSDSVPQLTWGAPSMKAVVESVRRVVLAPGANACKLTELEFVNLRPGIRLQPLGPVHNG